MIIEKLHLKHFGKFENLDLELDSSFTVLYGKNEDGKSTILDAIQLTFYGSDSQSADPHLNLRHRYFDRMDEAAEVTIYFEEGGRFYRLERIFGKTNGRDQINLYDNRTGDEIPLKKNQTPGDYFFAMNANSFRRSFYVGSRGAVISTSGKKDQLIDRLVNIETTGDERVSYVSVANRLKEESKKLLNFRKNGGLIYDAEENLRELKSSYEEALEDEKIKNQADQDILEWKEQIESYQQSLKELQERKQELGSQLNQASLYQAWQTRKKLKELERESHQLSKLLQYEDELIDQKCLLSLRDNLSEWKRIRDKRAKRALQGKDSLATDQEERELYLRADMLNVQKGINEEKIKSLDKDLEIVHTQKLAIEEQLNQDKNKKEKIEEELFKPAASISAEDMQRMKDKQPKKPSIWIRIRNMVLLWLFRWSFIILFILVIKVFRNEPPAQYYYLIVLIALSILIIYVGFWLKKYREKKKQIKRINDLEDKAFQERMAVVVEDQKKRAELQSELNEIQEDLKEVEDLQTQLTARKTDLENSKAKILKNEEVLKDQFYEYQSDLRDFKSRKQALKEKKAEIEKEEMADIARQKELAAIFSSYERDWEKKKNLRDEMGLVEDYASDGMDPSQRWESLLSELTKLNQELQGKEQLWDHLYQSLPEEYKLMSQLEFQGVLEKAGFKDKDPQSPDDLARILNQTDNEIRKLRDQISTCDLNIVEKESAIREKFAGQATAETLALQIQEEEKNYQKLLEKKESLDLAQQVLQEAYRETEDSFSPILNERAGEILSKLTGDDYDQVKVNKQFDLAVEEKETKRLLSWKLLSTGTAEQAYFCLRLALVDLIDQKGSLPILLDDPFVYYDDLRAQRAFLFLEDYAEESGRQILFFSAHQRFKEWSLESDKARLIELS